MKGEIIKICDHHKRSKLGYNAWHEWARKKTNKGEKQSRCPICKLYFFPEEMNEESVIHEQ